jgi:hypothetical protein
MIAKLKRKLRRLLGRRNTALRDRLAWAIKRVEEDGR